MRFLKVVEFDFDIIVGTL